MASESEIHKVMLATNELAVTCKNTEALSEMKSPLQLLQTQRNLIK